MIAPTDRAVYHNRAAEKLLESESAPDKSATCPKVQAFHRQLDGYAPTPLRPLDGVAKELGVRRVLLKDEGSRFGLPSFKILGASWATFRALVDRVPGLDQDATSIDQLKAALPSLGGVTLFAATDGNHGRAVARMGTILSVDVQIHVPAGLPASTIALIKAEGRTVVMQSELDYDGAVREAFEAAQAFGEAGVLIQDTSFEGYTQFPQWMVDGYSTMFHEIDDQLGADNSLDLVVVPVGVGSFAQAVVTYFKLQHPNAAILAVEPDTAACLQPSLRAGKPVTVKTSSTIMNGLECGTVSEIAWPILRAGIDASVTISDQEAHRALQELREGYSIEAGPCGAAPLAALRRLTMDDKWLLALDEDSTILLLSTEGRREYEEP